MLENRLRPMKTKLKGSMGCKKQGVRRSKRNKAISSWLKDYEG